MQVENAGYPWNNIAIIYVLICNFGAKAARRNSIFKAVIFG
jgi:hypothetical protein